MVSDPADLEALQMDTLEWNPDLMITEFHQSSENNDIKLSNNIITSSVKTEPVAQGGKMDRLHSDEEMLHQFELIKRRQSQYTPVCNPARTLSPTSKNDINVKEKRPPFSTSLEDGVEMYY